MAFAGMRLSKHAVAIAYHSLTSPMVPRGTESSAPPFHVTVSPGEYTVVLLNSCRGTYSFMVGAKQKYKQQWRQATQNEVEEVLKTHSDFRAQRSIPIHHHPHTQVHATK